ncbi:PREDICTED: serine/threonine-phosphatase 7 long [Prunus dulcis]|uniref:PREDICTED: serine/threonine-phosphatase 7 long n=1 Tax=Prunus dulcis TaxID=3755 RepID=A0A5E4FUY1_PRUDU|nr:PREDICTED: serine/threonine-phosphatase 7 long [Prunus dulcis]
MFDQQLRKQLWSLPRRPSEETFVKLQEFLEVQAFKIPALQERLGVAAEKIVHLRANLDAAVERQTMMDEVPAAFVDKNKIAKQKLASMNPQAADIDHSLSPC